MIIGYTSSNMNCKLKVKDPYIKSFLDADEFESFEEFKETIQREIEKKGLIPVRLEGNKTGYQRISLTEDGKYVTGKKTYSPESIAAFFLTTFQTDKETVKDLVKAEFKKIKEKLEINQPDLLLLKDFRSLAQDEMPELYEDLDEFISVFETTYEPKSAEEPGEVYLYTTRPSVEPQVENKLVFSSEVDVARQSFLQSLEKGVITVDGKTVPAAEVYLRVEPDSLDYIQTGSVTEEQLSNVVIFYLKQGSSFTPLYIHKDTPPKLGQPVEFTTQKNDAYTIGGKSQFVFWLPNIIDPIYEKFKTPPFGIPQKVKEAATRFKQIPDGRYYRFSVHANTATTHKSTKSGKATSKDYNYKTPDEFSLGKDLTLSVAETPEQGLFLGQVIGIMDGVTVPFYNKPVAEEYREDLVELFKLASEETTSEDTKRKIAKYLNSIYEHANSDFHFLVLKSGEFIGRTLVKSENGKIVPLKNGSQKLTVSNFSTLIPFVRVQIKKEHLAPGAQFTTLKVKNGQVVPATFLATKWLNQHLHTHAGQSEFQGELKNIKWYDAYLTFSATTGTVLDVSEQPTLSVEEFIAKVDKKDFSPEALRLFELIVGANLYNKVKDMPITFGEFNLFKDGAIQLASGPNVADNFVHELIHALTVEWVENNPDSIEVERLAEIATEINFRYGEFTDKVRIVQEFLASLGRKDVVEELQRPSNKSLFDRLVDALQSIFKELFGTEQTVYNEAVQHFILIAHGSTLRAGDTNVITGEKVKPTRRSKSFRTLGATPEETLLEFKNQVAKEKGKLYLDTVIQSIAGDLASYVSQDMVALLSGELNYNEIFDRLYDTYLEQRYDENDNLIKSTPEREYFLDLILDNEDIIRQIFRTENRIFTFVKTAPGVVKTVVDDKVETSQIQISEEEDIEKVDTTEETTGVDEEQDQIKQDLKEALEGATKPQTEFGRSGNSYSFDEAEKEVRYIVKMLPAIEMINNKPRIYTLEEKRQAILNDVSLTSQFFYPVNKEKTKYIRLAKDVNGAVKLNDNMVTWNKLGYMFRNKLSLTEMMETTFNNERTLDIVPEFYALYSWLHVPTEDGFVMNMTEDNFHLYTKIETAFKRFSNELWKVLNSDGVMNAVNEGADITNLTDKIVDDRFRRNIEEWNASEFFNIENSTFDLKSFKEKLEISNKDTLLEFLGFEFVPEVKDSDIYDKFKRAVFNFIEKTGREDSIPIGITNFIRKDYEKEGVKEPIPSLNSSYKGIHKFQHTLYPYTYSAMVKNAEGENQSTDSIPNSILLDAHIYNTHSLEEIQRLIPRANNPLFKRTIAYKSLFKEAKDKEGNVVGIERTKNKILVENFNGVSNVQEGVASTGALNVNLEEDIKVLSDFISLLTVGISENTRAQVSTTSYSVRMDNYNGGHIPIKYDNAVGVLQGVATQEDDTHDNYLYQVWTDYLRGELEEGHKNFYLFDFLSDDLKKSLLDKGLTFENKKAFHSELRGHFLKQYEEFTKALNAAGGLQAALPEGASNKLTSLWKDEKRAGVEEADIKENFLFHFVVNKMTLYVEEITLFQGSLSVLGDKYFKRANTVQSTRIPPTSTQEIRDMINRLLQRHSFASTLFGSDKAFVLRDEFKTAIKQDFIQPSPHLDKMKKGFVESAKQFYEEINQPRSEVDLQDEADLLLEKYEEVNISDGGGNIIADAYMSYMMSLGSNPKLFKGFKALMYDMVANKNLYFADELKNTPEIFSEEFRNRVLTETEIQEMNEGLKLIESGEVVFPTLKWTYRGGVVTDSIVAPEALNKFSLFPLFIQYVYDKPSLKAEFLGMLQQGLAYTKFESGEKIYKGGLTDLEKQAGKPVLDFSDSVHILLTHNLGEQIKTPTQAKQENTYGSQIRKLIISSLKTLNNESIQEYLSDWEKTNKKISKSIKDKILKDFGVTDDGKLDLTAVARILRHNALNREMTKNVIQFLEAVESGDYSNFGVSFNKKEVENLISNVIRRISVQKLRGAQLIQVTSAQDHLTDPLGWYTDGRPAECKVSLMGSYLNLLNLPEVQAEVKKMDQSQVNILSKTRILNKLLRDPKFREKYDKELTLVTYRIPTQGLNSMDVYTIKEFLPPFQSPQIVLPPEATVKSGTDYDYDKASAIFPSIGKDGRLISGSVPSESTTELKEKLDNLKEQLSPLFEAKKELKQFFKNLENLEETIDDTNLTMAEVAQLMTSAGLKEIELKENLDSLHKQYGKTFKEFLNVKKKLQLKKSATLLDQNKLLETAKAILLHPSNYFRLITPNSDAIIMKAAKEVFDLMGINTGEPKGSEIISYLTNLRKWRVVKGKDLLGIVAVANTFFTLMQTYNARFSRDFGLKYTRKAPAKLSIVHFGLLSKEEENKILRIEIGEGGKPYTWIDATSNFDAEGKIMKQEVISQLINVTVDMPGNDKFGYLNFHKGNFGAALYLIMVQGVPFDRILKLFHQPAVYTYDALVNSYKKKKSTITKERYNRREARLKALSELYGEPIEVKMDKYDNPFEDFSGFEELLHKIIETKKKKVRPDTLPELGDINNVIQKKLDDTQLEILAYYLSVLNEAEEMRKVDRVVNFDRSPDNIVMKTVDRTNLREEVEEAGFIDYEFVKKVTQNSVISGLNTSEVITKVSTLLFPSLYTPINVRMFEGLSKGVFKKDVFFNKVTNDFLSSIVQNFAVIEHEGQDQKIKDVGDYYILGDGRFELVKQANQLRKTLAKEGQKMRLLEVLLNSVSKKGDKSNVQLFLGFENASPDKDHLTENFRELLRNPETRDFATGLIATGIIQSGYSKSPLFFSDIIPWEFISPIIDKANDQYLLMDDMEQSAYAEAFQARFMINEGFLFGNRSALPEAYRYKDYSFNMKVVPQETPVTTQPAILSSEIKGEEISSYSDNLAFALTNPTHTSPTGKIWNRTWTEGQKKWRDYLSKGIEFDGVIYKDVEEAYQKNKNKYPIGESRNEFMKDLIKIKLQTYPKLVEGIDAKGGLGFILKSTHQPTKQNSYWETGGENGFIRMLAKAYTEVKGEQQPIQPAIEISQSKYTRQSVESDPNTMYLFTDNAERTSAPNASIENVDKNSWYYKKYKSQTNKPIHFGTLNNPTSAVIRGLNNAYPISTMSAYGTNWIDENFELFKKTIDDEINQIKADLSKFKKLKIGDFRIGQGGLKAKLPIKHQNYLDNKLQELGIDNTGNSPVIIQPTQDQPASMAEIERLQQELDQLKLTLELMEQEGSPVMQVMEIIRNTKFKPDSIKKETGFDVGSSKDVLPFLTSKNGKSIPKLAEEISELKKFENTGITYEVVFNMIVDYVSNPKSFNTKAVILKDISKIEKQLDKLAPLQKFKQDDDQTDCEIPF